MSLTAWKKGILKNYVTNSVKKEYWKIMSTSSNLFRQSASDSASTNN